MVWLGACSKSVTPLVILDEETPSEGTHLESTQKVLMLENAASTHEY